MQEIKSGIKLVIISIFLSLISTICNVSSTIIMPYHNNVGVYLGYACNALLLLSYIFEFIGFNKAGKKNEQFNKAKKDMILPFLLIPASFILSAIGNLNKNLNILISISFIIDFCLSIWHIFIVRRVCKACKQVKPSLTKYINCTYLVSSIYYLLQISNGLYKYFYGHDASSSINKWLLMGLVIVSFVSTFAGKFLYKRMLKKVVN